MARKSAPIIRQKLLRTGEEYLVLESPEIWAVTYEGRPINLRHKYPYAAIPTHRYHKTLFPSKLFATKEATKLNETFGTHLFGVKLLEIKDGDN